MKLPGTPERLTAGSVLKEIAKIIAFCLSDGCVSRRNASKGGQAFTIEFFNKDKCLHEIFSQSFIKTFGVFPTLLPAKRTLCSLIHSREITLHLLKLCNSFRTRACNSHPICPVWNGKSTEGSCFNSLPTMIKGIPFPTIILPKWVNIPEISSEFLKIFFSCDGGVSIWISNNKFHKEISLGCGHPLLLQQIKILTEKVLNIPVKEKKNGIRLSKTESIRRFKEKNRICKGL